MAAKPLFDADALIEMFQTASARQGAQLKKAAGDATLAALQGRELTLKNIRGALKQVAEAASVGIAKNAVAGIDPEALLDKAVAGMDEALLKAVEANRTALATLAAQGADLRDKHLSKAVADLEKMEDSLLAAMKKAADGAGASMAGPWQQVLEKMQAGGTLSGAQAASAAEQMAEQMHSAVKTTRAASMKAAQALAESYTAMVSGVLLGMSEALASGGAAAAKKAPANSKK
jgi:predicted NUDIX family NTP pyrophosphohydrolase